MKKDVVIEVNSLSKKFCKSLKRSMIYGSIDIGKNLLGMKSNSTKLRDKEFWALDDISFEVKQGECLGIIGKNGSGKTTLLSLLNGIYLPDKGEISMKGKVGALISVGAGFHPLYTGKENIYINAAILGMSKEEVDEKYTQIVEFADIGDFLDMPVKNYSSGMFVRLGFAVAIHCNPDILLVDEILSVGDLKFRMKSEKKFNELLEKGASVVFVSHSLMAVKKICDKALLLEKGKIIYYGESENVVDRYNLSLNREELKKAPCLKDTKSKKSTEEIEIANCKAYQYNGNENSNEITLGKKLIIEFEYRGIQNLKDIEFRLSINSSSTNLKIANITHHKKSIRKGNRAKLKFTITNNNLHHGVYTINLAVASKYGYSHILILPHCTGFIIKNPKDKLEDIDYVNLIMNFKYSVKEIESMRKA